MAFRGLLFGASVVLAISTVSSAQAQTRRFNLDEQDASTGIPIFAKQAGLQIVAPADALAGARIPAIRGAMDTHVALRRVIAATGLEIVSNNGGVVILRHLRMRNPSAAAIGQTSSAASEARADATSPGEQTPQAAASDSIHLDDIVVTARLSPVPQRKAEASYSITILKSEDLKTHSTQSFADILQNVPGIWSESTQGVGSNNIRVRGIPNNGYAGLAVYEDNVPIQHDPGIGWANVDQYIRFDDSYDSVEAVRGGTSSIFAANAPGGLINLVPRKGTDSPTGTLEVTLGDYGLRRGDFFYGGPLGAGWKVALGGFYRVDNSVRDPGFTADKGGQVRIILTHDIDRGHVEFSFKYLNDDNIYQGGIPLIRTAGRVGPVAGFDGHFDTMTGPDGQHLFFRSPTDTLIRNIESGSANVDRQFTAKFDKIVGDDWTLNGYFRYRAAESDRVRQDPSSIAAATTYILKYFSAAKTGFAGTTNLKYQYVTHPADPFDPTSQNGNGLVAESAFSTIDQKLDESIGSLSVSHPISLFGQHNLTLGLYGTEAYYEHHRDEEVGLTDVRDHSRFLDVLALNASGRVLGSVTDNGLVNDGSKYANSNGHYYDWAVFGADEWEVTGRLRLDAGFRYEHLALHGRSEGSKAYNLGNSATLADNAALSGSGVFTPFDRDFHGLAWTVGANYQFQRSLGVFGRYTNTYRLPDISLFRDNANPPGLKRQDVQEAEAGIKFDRRRYGFFGTLFYTSFRNVQFSNTFIDPVLHVDNTTIAYANLKTYGLELEGYIQPVPWFGIATTGTFQNPKFGNYIYDQRVGGVLTTFNFNDNRPSRMPRMITSVRPTFTLLSGKLRISGEWQYLDKRYGDDADTVALPSFSQFNARISYDLTRRVRLDLKGLNVTNAFGLEEGNAKSGTIISNEGNSDLAIGQAIFGRSIIGSIRYDF